jgi:hypothetical protein
MPSPVYYFVSLRLLMHEEPQNTNLQPGFPISACRCDIVVYIHRAKVHVRQRGAGHGLLLTAVYDFTQTDSTISCNKNFH